MYSINEEYYYSCLGAHHVRKSLRIFSGTPKTQKKYCCHISIITCKDGGIISILQPGNSRIRDFIIFTYLFLFYLIAERQRQRSVSPAVSFPKCQHQLGMGQVEARGQELNQGFPCGGQGLNYLSHCLLSPKVCISTKPELEAELKLNQRHCNIRCGNIKQHLNHCAKYLPQDQRLTQASADP